MDLYLVWIQDHLLAVVAVLLTVVLIYHYLIERDTGVKLSKRYRNSIFEAQSKVFLNATQYLISGNKDLAIREFLSAVDINRETIDTYFALGGLFRSNGEIEKAISIHRSLIARENISESVRLRALKELALDFDKGGFLEKAIETYRDVLKINRDQYEVIQSLCRIYEDLEDWGQAYNYRIMLSKVGHENQAETISHILVQKAKIAFEEGDFKRCHEDLDDAFRFAPSVSGKILRLKLFLADGDLEGAKTLLIELLKEHPMYASFIFVSLEEGFKGDENTTTGYKARLAMLRDFFLDLDDKELIEIPSVILSKVRLLKESGRSISAHEILKAWMGEHGGNTEVMKAEYIKLLIELEMFEEAVENTKDLLDNLHQSLTKHFCSQCGYNSDSIFWRCPQCHEWETIKFRWKV
ncbi:MAG: lipopolysaccharide biosynthesis regulator YciM [Bacteriovoracaceae bacterium]|jgi:lipopolysaccharide biosynthesis regulator YciM